MQYKYFTFHIQYAIIQTSFKDACIFSYKEVKSVTKKELCEKYSVPPEMFDEYKSCGLCRSDCDFADSDIECISLMMSLKDAGLDSEHAKECMKLMYSDGAKCGKCLEILKKQRSRTLDEIHALEKQLENTDCLIYKLKKQIKE